MIFVVVNIDKYHFKIIGYIFPVQHGACFHEQASTYRFVSSKKLHFMLMTTTYKTLSHIIE